MGNDGWGVGGSQKKGNPDNVEQVSLDNTAAGFTSSHNQSSLGSCFSDFQICQIRSEKAKLKVNDPISRLYDLVTTSSSFMW